MVVHDEIERIEIEDCLIVVLNEMVGIVTYSRRGALNGRE
jgi:hypothetical protein